VRVAGARLAVEPRFLLLDEPFSQLDSLTRFELQDILLNVWESSGMTVVMVTHDIDEALYLSDRLLLMTDGPGATVGDQFIVPSCGREPGQRARGLALSGRAAHVVDFLEHHAHQSRPSPLDEVIDRLPAARHR
jgi:ABC-type nitrate/sulfonate/bicarbonate transport system ATPase subunit